MINIHIQKVSEYFSIISLEILKLELFFIYFKYSITNNKGVSGSGSLLVCSKEPHQHHHGTVKIPSFNPSHEWG